MATGRLCGATPIVRADFLLPEKNWNFSAAGGTVDIDAIPSIGASHEDEGDVGEEGEHGDAGVFIGDCGPLFDFIGFALFLFIHFRAMK